MRNPTPKLLKRLLNTTIIACAPMLAACIFAVAATPAQAYVSIPGTNCILRATAPIDIHDGNDPSEPWHGDGEVDCSSTHNIALDVYLTQLLPAPSGWSVIRSTINSGFWKAARKNLYSFSIPYLTIKRWYCTDVSATIDNTHVAHNSSRSVMVDWSGVEHFGTCPG